MYTLLCCDQSTNHFGMALITVDKQVITLEGVLQRQYTKATTIEKLVNIYKDVYNYSQGKDIDVVVYENCFFGKNANTLKTLSEGLGCLKLAVASSLGTDIPLLQVYRKQALVATCGTGNASKEDTINSIEDLFGIRLSSDCSDAVALGLGAIFSNRTLIEEPFFSVGWDVPYESSKAKKNMRSTKKKIDLKEASAIGRNVFEFKRNFKHPYEVAEV